MSAKLMKSLAKGGCQVHNPNSGQVRVYWDDTVRQYVDVDAHTTLDLMHHASVDALRKSKSLKTLIHDGKLLVV